MITECIRTLYQESVLESAIPQVLKRLGSFLQAGRAYIVSIHEDSLCEIYQWSTGGAQAATARRHNVPLSAIRRWLPSFDQRGCIVIEDVETLKDIDPAEYEFLRSQSVHSLVAAPMEMDGTLTGYLGVDNPLPDHMSNIASLLQTLCYFLMLAWRHAQSQKQLSQLSYYDRLTSFYNRNRYIEDTKDLSSTEVSVGIVYLDVNGLKDINDQYGHEYGDKVLVECARRMRSVFMGADFYRIGGDEFVIICPGMEKDVFHSKLRELKAQFQNDPHYQAAIGSQWTHKALLMLMLKCMKIKRNFTAHTLSPTVTAITVTKSCTWQTRPCFRKKLTRTILWFTCSLRFPPLTVRQWAPRPLSAIVPSQTHWSFRGISFLCWRRPSPSASLIFMCSGLCAQS